MFFPVRIFMYRNGRGVSSRDSMASGVWAVHKSTAACRCQWHDSSRTIFAHVSPVHVCHRAGAAIGGRPKSARASFNASRTDVRRTGACMPPLIGLVPHFPCISPPCHRHAASSAHIYPSQPRNCSRQQHTTPALPRCFQTIRLPHLSQASPMSLFLATSLLPPGAPDAQPILCLRTQQYPMLSAQILQLPAPPWVQGSSLPPRT